MDEKEKDTAPQGSQTLSEATGSPLDQLESFLEKQIATTMTDREAYVKGMLRCQMKIDGLKQSLDELRKLRASIVIPT